MNKQYVNLGKLKIGIKLYQGKVAKSHINER
jgi:hypothetical protein